MIRRKQFYSSRQGKSIKTAYPGWVLAIAVCMILAGILPMPIVYLLRRFQILKADLDIHQGSIRRNETTTSTKEMIDQDDDVSELERGGMSFHSIFFALICVFCRKKFIHSNPNIIDENIYST